MRVLVVGAGLSGLSTAMYLGLHGVQALVVERHPSTSIYPKARGQFPHTMEALRLAGVDQKMVAASPSDQTFKIVIAASAAGPVFKEILVDQLGPDLSALSTAVWAGCSQERAEPVLAERARELGAEIRFATELVEFQQDDDGVTATLRDLTTGETSEIRAPYMVAADGHRSPIRAALGIGHHGRGVLGTGTGVVFRADLGDVIPPNALVYLQNPELPGGGGSLVTTDEPSQYAVSVGLGDHDWLKVIRTATGIPDLAAEVVQHGMTSTDIKHSVADRFSDGRVHLVGDAARVMPPTGGFGGNSAIMDGFHLAWKLAMVVRGEAGPGLLDSHDPEQRPWSDFIAEQQYTAYVERMRPDLADDTLASPVDPVSKLFFGYRCLSDAVILEPDDDRELLENPEEPTGRPGSRAPHVMVDGKSVVELFGRGFVVLTGAQQWVDRATDLGLDAYLVGDEVTKTYGIGAEGAVLVRPDFVIAWRSMQGEGDLASTLDRVLSRV
ncbi:FAD-dependent monooxygenase [Actinocrispum wychmicini]|uniref:2-polyprenyl-6-methoxyphenol hydroxylase-like FAD-dependent oxidoreductase n=1 Tax=Actinocrispum wychmicini TaxID=1213861 RepID=A0A4R2IYZ5_9PSEU|nr:FAD-dependent monooxygenase [Actinocrispum wychmicini]TCO50834.1 2-polyprenyl-6-methoxyphenol hydroxylase-like FAD-dependent oxidoreductase [Actinocrispum wychmicini]